MSQRVLVVDDEAANRSALERILAREGLSVLQAADARAALELVRKEAPDLMLTDLKMPGMSGLDLMRAARAIDPALEVILMTAFGTVETAVEAMKDGAYDFVTKPLRRAEIVAAARKALEKRALVQENHALRAVFDVQRKALQLRLAAPPRNQRCIPRINLRLLEQC